MAQRAHHKCNRAVARRVQAKNQDADRTAIRRHGCYVFWALLAAGQINMRKVDGWQSLATTPIAQPIDLAA